MTTVARCRENCGRLLRATIGIRGHGSRIAFAEPVIDPLAHLSRPTYRTGTGMGGRIDDRDVLIAAGDGFAAAARDRPR
jgi:hypothetical protein